MNYPSTKEKARTPLEKDESADTGYDAGIAAIVQNVKARLGMSDAKVPSVLWTSFFDGRDLTPDFPYVVCRFARSRVYLSEALKGSLQLDEWRPLLTSELIFSQKFRGRRLRLMLLGLTLTLIVFSVLAFLVLNRLVLPSSQSISTALALLFFFGIVLVWNLVLISWGAIEPLWIPTGLFFRGVKRERLAADREAAQLLGRDSFLEVLNKLEGFVHEKQGSAPRTPMRDTAPSIPSIQERIRNLQASR